ncbi:MAG: phytoene/squalene synthase family protein [Candidatus Aminicenantes bacterium]|nr:phytoene/squalene synthase family protein [Candidatus Aminicenantes bacterium]
MVRQDIQEIFRKGSRTYFSSSRFFPRPIREDVSLLYAFVRSADNFVDVIPQKSQAFYAFWDRYKQSLCKKPVGDPVIDSFTDLMRRKKFQPEWTEAFLRSMEMDLQKTTYDSLEDTLIYIHGSAEVIGLMMAAIMELDASSHPHAALLGRAMQFINFIRDIAEDQKLGRNYFPQKDMKQFQLPSLDISAVLNNQNGFETFIRAQIHRYRKWQSQAETGFHFIPYRCFIPIKTASDMYQWTAETIEKNPMIVYNKKVKPSNVRIWRKAFFNLFAAKL